MALLKALEQESGFKNEYSEFYEGFFCDYTVEDYLDFPNYKFVIEKYNGEYFIRKENGLISLISSNSITAELKRMEADGLVMIGTQAGRRYATTIGNGPNYDDGEGLKFTTESIVLTTKGKSLWRYIWHIITENPVSLMLSLIAIGISLLALFQQVF